MFYVVLAMVAVGQAVKAVLSLLVAHHDAGGVSSVYRADYRHERRRDAERYLYLTNPLDRGVNLT